MESVTIHNFFSYLVDSKMIIERFRKSDKIIFSKVRFTSSMCNPKVTLGSIDKQFKGKEIVFENPEFVEDKEEHTESEKDLKDIVEEFGAEYIVTE